MIKYAKKGLKVVKADYIFKEEFEHICSVLTPPNRLAVRISLATGLRIGDVLSLPRETPCARFSVVEAKTNKKRTVRIPKRLLDEVEAMRPQIGQWYFPSPKNPAQHRTRQAVWADLKRAQACFRIPSRFTVSPHSARKIFAVEAYRRNGDLGAVKRLLNHDNEATTVLYCMADVLTERRKGKLPPL